MIPPIEILLLGVIATTSVIAGLYFYKFWRETRDILFLAFAASFLVRCLNHVSLVFMDKPNEGSPWNYLVQCVSSVLIVAAILGKNLGRGKK